MLGLGLYGECFAGLQDVQGTWAELAEAPGRCFHGFCAS